MSRGEEVFRLAGRGEPKWMPIYIVPALIRPEWGTIQPHRWRYSGPTNGVIVLIMGWGWAIRYPDWPS